MNQPIVYDSSALVELFNSHPVAYDYWNRADTTGLNVVFPAGAIAEANVSLKASYNAWSVLLWPVSLNIAPLDTSAAIETGLHHRHDLAVGAEVRRLRQQAGLSGEQVADALGWSQPKVSRIEAGRNAFTVRDIASLLALYGVGDDVRAELMGATAADTGEGAWIVRAGGYPRRQGSLASLEAVTTRLRHYQIITVPGLLQTREYARAITAAAGVPDPDAAADARIRRQAVVRAESGPQYDVVLDARAAQFRR